MVGPRVLVPGWSAMRKLRPGSANFPDCRSYAQIRSHLPASAKASRQCGLGITAALALKFLRPTTYMRSKSRIVTLSTLIR
jgi:hypothetical protein